MILGVRTSVISRGAFPKVPFGAALNAESLSHFTVGWSADPRQSARSPEQPTGVPVRFGRRLFPRRFVPDVLCEIPIGNPLWKLKTAASIQPPASALPTALLPIA